VRGQPATVVGFPDQCKPVRAERRNIAGPVRIPSVHVALAPIPEVQGSPTIRAQDDHLLRLWAQVGDSAIRTPPTKVARVDSVHTVAGQVRQVQRAAARDRTLRQGDVKHVPPAGAVVRDRLRQDHPKAAVRLHFPYDHRPRRCVRHVHKRLPVISIVSRDVV